MIRRGRHDHPQFRFVFLSKEGVRDGQVALSRQSQNVQFLLVVVDEKADFPPFASGSSL